MKNDKTTIFVDGNCIVCDLEVSHYVRRCPQRLQAVDIADPRFNAASYGLDRDAVQKHLHVLDREGNLHIGVAAFAQIWSEIDSLKWASRWIRKPPFWQLAQVGYEVFAVARPYLLKKKRAQG